MTRLSEDPAVSPHTFNTHRTDSLDIPIDSTDVGLPLTGNLVIVAVLWVESPM